MNPMSSPCVCVTVCVCARGLSTWAESVPIQDIVDFRSCCQLLQRRCLRELCENVKSSGHHATQASTPASHGALTEVQRFHMRSLSRQHGARLQKLCGICRHQLCHRCRRIHILWRIQKVQVCVQILRS